MCQENESHGLFKAATTRGVLTSIWVCVQIGGPPIPTGRVPFGFHVNPPRRDTEPQTKHTTQPPFTHTHTHMMAHMPRIAVPPKWLVSFWFPLLRPTRRGSHVRLHLSIEALTWIERQNELNWRFRHIFSLVPWPEGHRTPIECV